MSDHREDHGDRHGSTGPDPILSDLDANARVAVRKNSGGTVVKRRRINTIEGTGILLTLVDDAVNEEADLTIAQDTTWLDSHTDGLYIRKDIGTTKGDFITFTGSGTPVRHAKPADNTVPYGDSAQSDGWNSGAVGQALIASGFRLVAISAAAPSSPSAYDVWIDTTNKVVKIRNSANAVWIQLTPKSATVATSETRNVNSYADLTTAGPSVTIDTGTEVIITEDVCVSGDNALGTYWAAPVVSGATTLAAADANGVRQVGLANAVCVSRRFRLTGLTAGSNTFKLQYKPTAGTGTWRDRDLTIEPLIT